MPSIEIDFDTYKALTARRATEATTYGDVVRELVGLAARQEGQPVPVAPGVTLKGVHFPEGTLFRAVYKGATYTAEIKNGRWVDSEGVPRSSPSQAAHQITGSGVNGWGFWECRRPTDGNWIKIGNLRPSALGIFG